MLYTNRIPAFLFFFMTLMVVVTGCGKDSPMSSMSMDESPEIIEGVHMSGQSNATEDRRLATKIAVYPVGHLPDFPSGIYTIQCVANGKMVGARNADRALVAAYDNASGSSEQFEVINHGSGKITFRNLGTGKYVYLSGSDHRLYATESDAGAHKFDLWAEHSVGEISINAPDGNWVSARLNASDAPLEAVASTSQAWERFIFDQIDGIEQIYPVGHLPDFASGIYTIQCVANGKMVGARNADRALVAAYDNASGSSERFEVVNHGSGKITFRNLGTGKYVYLSGSDHRLYATESDAGAHKFDLWAEHSAGEISINAPGGNWVSARLDASDAPLEAVASTSQAWERFTFKWVGDYNASTAEAQEALQYSETVTSGSIAGDTMTGDQVMALVQDSDLIPPEMKLIIERARSYRLKTTDDFVLAAGLKLSATAGASISLKPGLYWDAKSGEFGGYLGTTMSDGFEPTDILSIGVGPEMDAQVLITAVIGDVGSPFLGASRQNALSAFKLPAWGLKVTFSPNSTKTYVSDIYTIIFWFDANVIPNTFPIQGSSVGNTLREHFIGFSIGIGRRLHLRKDKNATDDVKRKWSIDKGMIAHIGVLAGSIAYELGIDLGSYLDDPLACLAQLMPEDTAVQVVQNSPVNQQDPFIEWLEGLFAAP